MKLMRFAYGSNSLRNAAAQYCSTCDAPITTAMFLVAGAIWRMSSTKPGRSKFSPMKVEFSLAHREVKAVDPFQCRGWEFSETGGPGIAQQRRPRVSRLAPLSPVANVIAAFAGIQPGPLAKLNLHSAPYPARLRRDQRVFPSSRPVRSQKRSNEW